MYIIYDGYNFGKYKYNLMEIKCLQFLYNQKLIFCANKARKTSFYSMFGNFKQKIIYLIHF